MLIFFISSSFGRQLSEKCWWAGSELNVRTHITKPPCLINCHVHVCSPIIRFPSFLDGKNDYLTGCNTSRARPSGYQSALLFFNSIFVFQHWLFRCFKRLHEYLSSNFHIWSYKRRSDMVYASIGFCHSVNFSALILIEGCSDSTKIRINSVLFHRPLTVCIFNSIDWKFVEDFHFKGIELHRVYNCECLTFPI